MTETQSVKRHNAAYQLPLEALDVVLVEDSKQMQTIVRSMLVAMRVMRVRSFESAEDALQAMLVEPPNLLISDWRMEPMTGYQMLRSIRHRQMDPLCFVPFLMITAHGTRSLVEKTVRAGAHHVLVKPFAPSSLHQRIEAITRDDRMFRVDPQGDFYVIDGVAEALAKQSVRRQALDRARIHHAMNGPAAVEPAPAPKQPAESVVDPKAPKQDRGLGALTRRNEAEPAVQASPAQARPGGDDFAITRAPRPRRRRGGDG